MKRRVSRFFHWQYGWLIVILLFLIGSHAYLINKPVELVFDEQHYVGDARAIMTGQGDQRPEHPPLAKLEILGGMLAFGDNPVGWRIAAVVNSIAGVLFFFLICKELNLRPRTVNMATAILAFENLTFVQGSVAMLDVFMVTLILLGFWLYLKGYYPFAAVAIALSALCKLNGVLALPAIMLHWVWVRRDRPVHFVASMILAPLSFMLFLPLFQWVMFHKWMNPLESARTMLSLSGTLTFATTTHDAARRPWDWVLHPQITAYWYTPHYFGSLSLSLWALVIPLFILMCYLFWKRHNAGTFTFVWFLFGYIFWIPADIITDRITFPFYFYPTVGAVALALAIGLARLLSAPWRMKRVKWLPVTIVTAVFVLHLAVFYILSPFNPLAWDKLIPFR